MKGPFKAKKISENVYWVGAIDWNIRNFHGYNTSRGTTYNAYLVMADKITLVDTVKAPFKDEMYSRIESIVDPEKIDVIISNHAEMDHSGCLMDAIDRIRPSAVYASKMGSRALKDHFHSIGEINAVKSGDSISLGNMNVNFVETRMIHWPDSMFSYIPEEKLLFSQDGFGMHLATYNLFADENPEWLLVHESEKYFANILLPFTAMIKKTLDGVMEMNLDVQFVCPDHGPIWRGDDIPKVFDYYYEWSDQKPTEKAVIIYDTMWQSTDLMARSIAEGLAAGGAVPKLLRMDSSNRSDVATEILKAGAIILGSPTLNCHIFPTMADVIVYLTGLKPKNKIGSVFGSYGWGGQSVPHLHKALEEMGAEIVEDDVKHKYVPDEAKLEACYEMGQKIAEKLLQKVAEEKTETVKV